MFTLFLLALGLGVIGGGLLLAFGSDEVETFTTEETTFDETTPSLEVVPAIQENTNVL